MKGAMPSPSGYFTCWAMLNGVDWYSKE